MIRRSFMFLLLLALGAAAPRSASASAIVLLGLDPTADAHSYQPNVQSRNLVQNAVEFAAGKTKPNIALFMLPEPGMDQFGLDTDNVLGILGFTFERFTPGALATQDLSAFDLLYFGPTTNAAAIDAYFDSRAKIADFALNGKGLIVEPNVASGSANAWAWVPFASQIQHSGDVNLLNPGPNDIVKLASGAPAGLINGLTDTGLSNWSGSYHTQFLDPTAGGYTPFAYRADTGAAVALYLDTTAVPTPEPGTMVLLGSGAVAAALRRRRRK